MALKQQSDGTYRLASDADVREAIKLHKELQEELEDVQDLITDSTNLVRAIGEYMAAKNKDEIKADKVGFRAKLIQRFTRQWIGTKSEIPEDAPRGTKALRDLVPKEVWMKITTRVVDSAKLDEAVREGLISEKQIEAALYERPQKPFAQIYQIKDD